MRELLDKFCLNDSHPCTSPGMASVKAVVEFDVLQSDILYPLQNLPNRFEESDAPISPLLSGLATQSLPSTFAGRWNLLPKRRSIVSQTRPTTSQLRRGWRHSLGPLPSLPHGATPLCVLHVSPMLPYTGHGSAGRLLSEALLPMVYCL